MDDDMVIRAAIRDEVSGPLAGIREELRQTGRTAEQAGARAGRASSGWDRYAGGVGRVAKMAGRTAVRGLGLLATAATIAGGAAATVGIKTAASMQSARIAFTTMLGSARKADTFLRQLAAFAAKTPFEFPELQTAASALISAGIQADKVIPIMTTLGDVTAGMGTGSEGIKRATVALQQMTAAGKITGEDLNQLRDAGIPVYDLLAKATGKSKAQVVALAQAGKLGAKELGQMMKALETGKGLERFNGLMEKQSASLSGVWSTLKDTTQMGLAKALEPAVPVLSKLTLKASDLVGKGIGPLTDGIGWLIKRGTELERDGSFARWAGQGKRYAAEFWASVGPLVSSLLELGKDALPTVVGVLGTTVKLIEAGARVITPLVEGFNNLPGSAQKAVILAAAVWLLSRRLGSLKERGTEAVTSLKELDKRSLAIRGGVGAAGIALTALGTSAGDSHQGLKDVATVAGGLAIGFATGGPFGAAVGGAAAVMSIFARKSQNAAEAQAQLDQAAATVAGTLDRQSGALTRTTYATVAKNLADSGAYTAAQKVGASLRDVTNAALGDEAAKKRVTAATKRWFEAQDGGISSMQNAAKTIGKLHGAIDTTSEALIKERRHIQQTTSALDQLDKTNVHISIGGIRSTQAQLDRLNASIAKARAAGTAAHGSTGDTHTSKARRIGGSPTGNAAYTLAAHARTQAATGAKLRVTNMFTGGGGKGRGSGDHQAGKALDLQGQGMHAYARATRDAGGYAAFHGSGPDRHLHAVPAAGDTATSRARRRPVAASAGANAGPPVVIAEGAIQVNNPASTVDLAQGIADGIEAYLQERNERA